MPCEPLLFASDASQAGSGGKKAASQDEEKDSPKKQPSPPPTNTTTTPEGNAERDTDSSKENQPGLKEKDGRYLTGDMTPDTGIGNV